MTAEKLRQPNRANFRSTTPAAAQNFEIKMNREHLDTAIQRIRNYTNEHMELRAAHHFLYDLPLDRKAGKPEVVIMGVNPGETEYDRTAYPGPTEQTYYHDFHEKAASGRSRWNRNWNSNAVFFANGKPIVFTELFFGVREAAKN